MFDVKIENMVKYRAPKKWGNEVSGWMSGFVRVVFPFDVVDVHITVLSKMLCIKLTRLYTNLLRVSKQLPFSHRIDITCLCVSSIILYFRMNKI